MKNGLGIRAFINSTAAAVYIFIVSVVMQNGEKLFSGNDNLLTPFVILLLFSLSAAVVGGLIFGLSASLFFESKKAEAVKAAIYSVGWLGVYTVAGLLYLFALKG